MLNRPITVYSIYYSTDPSQPIKSSPNHRISPPPFPPRSDWALVNSSEPNRQHTLQGLSPDLAYTIRIRANDLMGPGKLSNPVSVRTLPAAKRPFLTIPEGAEIRVPPKTPFSINCSLSRGDPIPQVRERSIIDQ